MPIWDSDSEEDGPLGLSIDHIMITWHPHQPIHGHYHMHYYDEGDERYHNLNHEPYHGVSQEHDHDADHEHDHDTNHEHDYDDGSSVGEWRPFRYPICEDLGNNMRRHYLSCGHQRVNNMPCSVACEAPRYGRKIRPVLCQECETENDQESILEFHEKLEFISDYVGLDDVDAADSIELIILTYRDTIVRPVFSPEYWERMQHEGVREVWLEAVLERRGEVAWDRVVCGVEDEESPNIVTISPTSTTNTFSPPRSPGEYWLRCDLDGWFHPPDDPEPGERDWLLSDWLRELASFADPRWLAPDHPEIREWGILVSELDRLQTGSRGLMRMTADELFYVGHALPIDRDGLRLRLLVRCSALQVGESEAYCRQAIDALREDDLMGTELRMLCFDYYDIEGEDVRTLAPRWLSWRLDNPHQFWPGIYHTEEERSLLISQNELDEDFVRTCNHWFKRFMDQYGSDEEEVYEIPGEE